VITQTTMTVFISSLYLNEHVLLHRNDISIFIIIAQSNAQLLDQR